MKALADLGVAFVDLLEAEGRKLQTKVVRLGMAVAIAFASAMLLVIAIGLLLAAVFLGLEKPLGAPAAAVLTGVFCLVLAAGGLLWSRSLAR